MVSCEFKLEEPFFLTKSKSKLYSRAKVEKCSNPPPDTCKIHVVTEHENPGGVWIELPGGKTRGPMSCTRLKRIGWITTKGFKCHFTLVKTPFRTYVESTIEYHGIPDPEVHTSKVVHEYC